MKKKNLLDYLRTDRLDFDDSLKEQSFPMSSIDEENLENEDDIQDIEVL